MSHSNAVSHSLERVRRALASVVPPPRDKLAGNNKAAAVLVPIFERDGILNVVYIRRSDDVASHRGQVAFPGGRVDPVDQTVLDTALREAHEEVGIEPRTVEVLGALPTATTYTSGIIVSPFAGLIPHSTPFRPQESEVAEIFVVPLPALSDLRYRGEYEWARDDGKVARYPAILYGGQTIWGLTYRITVDLLAIIDGRAP